MRHLALISEHASPLAPTGGTDSGGQNVYVAHVARQLARRGWQVDVFTRREDPDSADEVAWLPGIRVIHVRAGPDRPIAKEQMLPLMREFTDEICARIDAERTVYQAVHANFFMSGLVGIALKQRYGLPLITTFHALGRVRRLHQGDNDAFPSERLAIEDQIVERSDALVAECPQDRRDLLDLYHADPARIEIIPCGFDPGELEPGDRTQARSMLGWPANGLTVLQLGRLVPRKGVDNVIEAMALLRATHGVAATLRIVGGNSDRPDADATPEIARLHALARHCGIDDAVHFEGRSNRERLRCYYQAADVFVSTPWYEPFGITPLEAMACACPVIGSAVGGIGYSVIEGRTGFLVPPRDPASLAERLARLASEPRRRDLMGAAGWARVRRHFTWSIVADRLDALYQRLDRSSSSVAL